MVWIAPHELEGGKLYSFLIRDKLKSACLSTRKSGFPDCRCKHVPVSAGRFLLDSAAEGRCEDAHYKYRHELMKGMASWGRMRRTMEIETGIDKSEPGDRVASMLGFLVRRLD